MTFEVLGFTDDGWLRVRLGDVEDAVPDHGDAFRAVWEEAVRRVIAAAEAAPEELRPRLLPLHFRVDQPPAQPTAEKLLPLFRAPLVPPIDRLEATRRRVDSVVQPIVSGRNSLVPVPPARLAREGVRLTLQLVVREDDGSIRDLKEQDCPIVPLVHAGDPDRVEAYLRAWASAIGGFLERHLDSDEYMPLDLVWGAALDRKDPARAVTTRFAKL